MENVSYLYFFYINILQCIFSIKPIQPPSGLHVRGHYENKSHQILYGAFVHWWPAWWPWLDMVIYDAVLFLLKLIK